MGDTGGGDDLLARQKEFISAFFRKGAELAEELLRDNERLLTEVQALGRRYEDRLSQIERENHSLASLYVAAYQLHASLVPRDVLRTIVEILLNFIGAKTFVIYLLDADGHALQPAAVEGVDPAAMSPVAPGEIPASPTGATPLHTVTLRLREQVAGIIVVWELLAQKEKLDEVDHELFNLLGAQAATALEAARLAASARETP